MSPRRLRTAYRRTTDSSPLLKTVHSPPPEVAARSNGTEDAGALWQTLQSRRENAPRVLDDFERHLLAAYTESPPCRTSDRGHELGRLIDSVRSGPVRRFGTDVGSGRNPRGRLLIDARTLQAGRLDGTARHAAAVLERVLAHRENWEGVSLLIDPARDPVPISLAGPAGQIGFEAVDPELASRASAFLQLQPFHDLRHSEILDALLMTPWIRTATVWLDAIAGTYPRHFFAGPLPFFSYQWFVERLRHYDHVLALSDTARNEVLPLVGESSRVTVTGCRNPLRFYRHQAQHLRHAPSPETRVTLFGNALPHKNLTAGLFAFAYAYFRHEGSLHLDVVANLTDEQVAYARAVMNSVDTRLPAAIAFHRRIPDLRLSHLLANSSASIVPSLHEGFSLPVLESFDFDVPIVASAIPAHRELLGEDCPLAPPDDPVALGRNLLDALANPMAWRSRVRDAPISRCDARFEAGMAHFISGFCRNAED